jgi:hypothetical protein
MLPDAQPSADIRHGRTLSKVHIRLPKQAHDLLGNASLLHQSTRSSPTSGTKILSHDLDRAFGKGVTKKHDTETDLARNQLTQER